MQKIKIGNVLLYGWDGVDLEQPAYDEDDRLLQEIVQSQEEKDYHSQITACKNWTIMYQLAESRANVIEWVEMPQQAKILELGAGCGTITSALLKKGASVTCQEEKLSYCRINAVRHRQAEDGTLTVYAMPFAQCEPQLENDYDVITAVDVPMIEGESEQLLRLLRRHLKQDGLLVLAVKNKFGLKYWAGNKEMYTHRYFAGLENDGIRLHSGSGLKKLLKETGFGWQEFYYPYPDERFTLDIYSDRYLPKKGDLNYNIVNYEDDRMLLFDEQKVFDSVIEEGQFPFFANAYLCLAGAEGWAHPKQEAVYTRYASDRSREHAVCTQITDGSREHVGCMQITDGSREHAGCMQTADGSVRKRAMYAEGAAHVAHILEAYERLNSQYADTELKFNSCASKRDSKGNEYVEFELLHAQALQEQVEQAVAAGQLQKVFDILRRMMQNIRNDSRKMPFEMTDAFREVFGDIKKEAVLRQKACSEISDIDLILPNILVGEDGTWNVIDYEWTFFFPVPQDYIIYRTLFFLNHENPQREELSMEHLLQTAGISAEEAGIYAQMEDAFQHYVTGGLVPYREMVNLLGRRFFNVAELKADYDRIAAQNELLKGQGIWKAVRGIKKKLTGN